MNVSYYTNIIHMYIVKEASLTNFQKRHKMLQEKYLKMVSDKRREPQEKLLTQAKEMNLQKMEKERYSALKNKQKKKKVITSNGAKSKFDISNTEINETKSNDINNNDNAVNQNGNSQNISITILPPIEQSRINKDDNEIDEDENI